MSGRPTLTLKDGGTASYDAAHSSATSLVFDYTVASGQTNVASLAVTSVSRCNNEAEKQVGVRQTK